LHGIPDLRCGLASKAHAPGRVAVTKMTYAGAGVRYSLRHEPAFHGTRGLPQEPPAPTPSIASATWQTRHISAASISILCTPCRWPKQVRRFQAARTFLGRPPFAPLARALTRFASDRAAPPSLPSDAAASPGVASALINPCTLMSMSCSSSLIP
jgi:hypothetical protein